MKIAVLLFLCLLIMPVQAEEHEHGFVIKNAEGKILAWNVNESEWSSIESFWKNFAKSSEAKYWGKSNEYPNYDDVKEFDTFLIQSNEGSCLCNSFILDGDEQMMFNVGTMHLMSTVAVHLFLTNLTAFNRDKAERDLTRNAFWISSYPLQ